MGRRHGLITAAVGMALLGACHGPPLMSRVQPRAEAHGPTTPVMPPRTSSPLGATFLDQEGERTGPDTERMVRRVDEALQRRRDAANSAGPRCRDMGDVVKAWRPPKVGREEAGGINLDLGRLWNLLKKLAK